MNVSFDVKFRFQLDKSFSQIKYIDLNDQLTFSFQRMVSHYVFFLCSSICSDKDMDYCLVTVVTFLNILIFSSADKGMKRNAVTLQF